MDASVASPSKRRVLAALDVNASRSPAAKIDGLKPTPTPTPTVTLTPTTPSAPAASRATTPTKRLLDDNASTDKEANTERPTKKTCVEPVSSTTAAGVVKVVAMDYETETKRLELSSQEHGSHARQRSQSPACSSVFDTSAIDTSQTTNITEPEGDANPVPVPIAAPLLPPQSRPRSLTREQAREKAEILRLRLSLAGYKLRTGQTDVPLERLQVRWLPGQQAPPRLAARPVNRPQPEDVEDDNEEEDDEEDELELPVRRPLPMAPHRLAFSQSMTHAHLSPEKLPRLPAHASFDTPRRNRLDEDRLTSSGLRGGAAKGLLSLSRG